MEERAALAQTADELRGLDCTLFSFVGALGREVAKWCVAKHGRGVVVATRHSNCAGASFKAFAAGCSRVRSPANLALPSSPATCSWRANPDHLEYYASYEYSLKEFFAGVGVSGWACWQGRGGRQQ